MVDIKVKRAFINVEETLCGFLDGESSFQDPDGIKAGGEVEVALHNLKGTLIELGVLDKEE